MTRYRCFSGVRFSDQGSLEKIKKVASLRDNEDLLATQPLILFFLNDLDPDGCLVADQLRAYTKTFESTGADNKKGLLLNWILTLQKKDIIFCVGEVFSLDRGLLMGAINTGASTSISSTDIIFFCCQVKYILFLTTAKSTLNHIYIAL